MFTPDLPPAPVAPENKVIHISSNANNNHLCHYPGLRRSQRVNPQDSQQALRSLSEPVVKIFRGSEDTLLAQIKTKES